MNFLVQAMSWCFSLAKLAQISIALTFDITAPVSGVEEDLELISKEMLLGSCIIKVLLFLLKNKLLFLVFSTASDLRPPLTDLHKNIFAQCK